MASRMSSPLLWPTLSHLFKEDYPRVLDLGFHEVRIGFIEIHESGGIGNEDVVNGVNGILENLSFDNRTNLRDSCNASRFDNQPLEDRSFSKCPTFAP